MNTNASMFDRAFAIFLDLLTFLGFSAGFMMVTLSTTAINDDLQFAKLPKETLIKNGIVIVVVYLILDILLTRIFATTPGKLCMNCDVDFHMGNTMVYNIIRSFIKIICLFSVVLGLFSYFYGTSNPDSRTFHDMIAKTNVTNTTRMPRVIGVLVVLTGIALLIFFIVTYHDALGINPSLGLPDYQIFDL